MRDGGEREWLGWHCGAACSSAGGRTRCALPVDSHFASGQRLFAYAAGEEKKAEEGEAGAAGAAGNGAGIPAAGQGRTFWAGQAEASLSIDREEGTANGIGTVFVQRISGPLSSVVVVVAVAVVVVCSHKGSYPAFVIVVCDFSHFAK